MNQVTILGATGMLGSACLKVIPGASHPSRAEFDAIKDKPNFQGWVINCIGAIPQRILDEDLMTELNSNFPKRLAQTSAKIIQIATDCVFSGLTGGYTESSTPDPVDAYGRSKLVGEIPTAMNIRCSIIGPDKTNASLFEWVRTQPEGATIQGYEDHIWNGVSTHVFAKLAKGIIENNFWIDHKIHFVPRNSLPKYEIVKLIAKKSGREDLNIVPKDTGQKVNRTLKTDYPELNKKLWKIAGYDEILSIEQIIQEMPL